MFAVESESLETGQAVTFFTAQAYYWCDMEWCITLEEL